MKNKFAAILALLLVFAMLFGCSNAKSEEKEKTTAASTTVQTSDDASTASTEKKDESTSEPKEKSNSKSNGEKNENKNEKTEPETVKPNSHKKKKRKKLKEASTTKKHSQTTTKASGTTVKKPDKNHCVVTIECKEILKNLGKLKDGHEAYVPKDGIIISSASVKYSKGDNVYTVLKRVCRENGIKMTAKLTSNGMYVIGINNLDEKDCGGVSGWTYYVNGKFPNFSCDKYELKGGEVIEFKYVV